MMKKLSRFIALILVLVTVFLVPVSASEVDNTGSWTNVLDYATLNDSGSNYINFSNTTTVRFDTKQQRLVRFIDIVVNTAGADITSASVNGNQLTVLPLDSQVFRVYGQVSNILTGVFDITFTASGTCYLDFMQFLVNGQWRLSYPDIGSVSTGNHVYTQSTPSSYVTFSLDPEFNDLVVTSAYWKRYDYLDFTFRYFDDQGGISSISANFNGIALPVEVSRWTSNDKVEDPVNYAFFWRDCYWVTIRVDLRGLDRTIVASPEIHFTCGTGSFYLMSTVGSVVVDSTDPLLHYFRIYADAQLAYYSSIRTAQENLYNLVFNGFKSISSDILAFGTQLADAISALQTSLSTQLSVFRLSMEDWFSTISGKLDQLIGSTSDGDELSQGADDLEDQISDVHDFEQEQQQILDNALPDMQQAVAVTKFSSALAFVQRYINMGWLALGDFTIIYTLPIFIGLFFFICGRLPGVTRWSYKPPKGGGSK